MQTTFIVKDCNFIHFTFAKEEIRVKAKEEFLKDNQQILEKFVERILPFVYNNGYEKTWRCQIPLLQFSQMINYNFNFTLSDWQKKEHKNLELSGNGNVIVSYMQKTAQEIFNKKIINILNTHFKKQVIDNEHFIIIDGKGKFLFRVSKIKDSNMWNIKSGHLLKGTKSFHLKNPTKENIKNYLKSLIKE